MGDSAAGPVLVVEDDPSIRELLVEALTQEGLRAVPAADGAEAVRIALSERPGVVLLDIGLPFLDGTGVAARIRDAYGDTVAFIVVTAGRQIDDAAGPVRASSYLGKPFDIDDLVKAVRAALAPAAVAAYAAAKPSVA